MPLSGIAPSSSTSQLTPAPPPGFDVTLDEAADEQARELAIIFQELQWDDERKAEAARHEDKNRAMNRLRAVGRINLAVISLILMQCIAGY